MLRRGFQALRLGTAVVLRRDFQALRLGTALVAMISLASEVWTLLSDDLSSVIFWTIYTPNNPLSLFKPMIQASLLCLESQKGDFTQGAG